MLRAVEITRYMTPPRSVDDWLRIYSEHPYDHANQIRAAGGGAR